MSSFVWWLYFHDRRSTTTVGIASSNTVSKCIMIQIRSRRCFVKDASPFIQNCGSGLPRQNKGKLLLVRNLWASGVGATPEWLIYLCQLKIPKVIFPADSGPRRWPYWGPRRYGGEGGETSLGRIGPINVIFRVSTGRRADECRGISAKSGKATKPCVSQG